MATLEEKKQFALAAIGKYYKNPSLRAFENNRCVNKMLADDGTVKMCVFGQFIDYDTFPELQFTNEGAEEILEDHGEYCLIPSAKDILAPFEWATLQRIHDNLIGDQRKIIADAVKHLNLFTMNELIEYAENLKEE